MSIDERLERLTARHEALSELKALIRIADGRLTQLERGE